MTPRRKGLLCAFLEKNPNPSRYCSQKQTKEVLYSQTSDCIDKDVSTAIIMHLPIGVLQYYARKGIIASRIGGPQRAKAHETDQGVPHRTRGF